MNNVYTIYDHVSPSGKHYIGQTSLKPEKRWGKDGAGYLHKKNGEYSQLVFARAIIKYGWDKFQHNIIHTTTSKSECDYTEAYLIKWYKMQGLSYNMSDSAVPSAQKYFSEEERKEARREQDKTRYEKHKTELNKKQKEYYYAHKEARIEYQKAYDKAHKEKRNAYMRE